LCPEKFEIYKESQEKHTHIPVTIARLLKFGNMAESALS
jgi:hypothetical protein